MATAERAMRPDDIAEPGCWPCWHAEGWEAAAEWSMQDATKVSRAKAHHRATWDYDWNEIGVWKRYIRLLTRQESYECNRLSIDEPQRVPDDWRPGEDDPVWEFVHRSHPDARPYWVVGLREDGPPPNPEAPAPTGEDG